MTLKQLLTGGGGLVPRTITVLVEKKTKDDEAPTNGAAQALSFGQWCTLRSRARELERNAAAMVEHALGTQKAVQGLIRKTTATRQSSCQCGGIAARTGAAVECDCIESQLAEFCCAFILLRERFDCLSEFADGLCGEQFADMGRMSGLQERMLGISPQRRDEQPPPQPSGTTEEGERAELLRRLAQARAAEARANRRLAEA